jgi:serine O-acetyltransferase
VIGGNVWLTHSVPPGSSVSQGKIREGDRKDDGGR